MLIIAYIGVRVRVCLHGFTIEKRPFNSGKFNSGKFISLIHNSHEFSQNTVCKTLRQTDLRNSKWVESKRFFKSPVMNTVRMCCKCRQQMYNAFASIERKSQRQPTAIRWILILFGFQSFALQHKYQDAESEGQI